MEGVQEDVVDLDFRDGRSRHGRKQHAPQRVAERVPEPPLKRLDHDARLAGRDGLNLHDAGFQEFRD
jgi:hypothetical protein